MSYEKPDGEVEKVVKDIMEEFWINTLELREEIFEAFVDAMYSYASDIAAAAAERAGEGV